MLRRFSIRYAVFSVIMDLVLTFAAFSIAIFIRPLLPPMPLLVQVNGVEVPLWTYWVVPFSWVFVFLVVSVYDAKRTYKIVDELQSVTIGSLLASLLCAGLFFLAFREFSRYVFITFIVLNISFLFGWRIVARIAVRMIRIPAAEKRVLVVGAGDVGRRVGAMINSYEWMGLSLVGFVDDENSAEMAPAPIIGRLAETRSVVMREGIDDVVIALPQDAYGYINTLVLALQDLSVNMRVVPDYFSLALYKASVDDFGGVPMISLRDPALNEFQRLVKRVFDLLFSSISLLFLSPVMLLIALLIKLDSNGPIIFRQKRVGENGQLFDMYKFRSMVVGAEKMQVQLSRKDANGKIVFKHRDDPRVTRIGRMLRRSSLDELPQLLNVLLGDMSLVGPRPELPWLVGQYEAWQHKRFAVPQGITGWWQVNGRADKPLHMHTEDDLYYIQNYSLWMDFYILFKTPLVVLRGKGAY